MKKSGKPISPQEIPAQINKISGKVLDVWNDMIVQKYNGKQSVIMQDDIIKMLMEAMGVSRKEVFDNKWLDIEKFYEANGWIVVYDKPAYNESYPASFTFKAKNV